MPDEDGGAAGRLFRNDQLGAAGLARGRGDESGRALFDHGGDQRPDGQSVLVPRTEPEPGRVEVGHIGDAVAGEMPERARSQAVNDLGEVHGIVHGRGEKPVRRKSGGQCVGRVRLWHTVQDDAEVVAVCGQYFLVGG